MSSLDLLPTREDGWDRDTSELVFSDWRDFGWQISISGGIEPRWSQIGHELMYRSGDQILAARYTVEGDAFVAEKPRVWIEKPGFGAEAGLAAWDPAHEGKRVVAVTPVESAAPPRPEHQVVFIQNFFDEPRRRVPLAK